MRIFFSFLTLIVGLLSRTIEEVQEKIELAADGEWDG